MGKYMRKAKITADVPVMDLSLGVRTRAKTLALQKLQETTTKTSPPPPVAASAAVNDSELSYLQLRSRRLEKPSSCCKPNPQAKILSCRNPSTRNVSRSGRRSASISGEGFLGEIKSNREEQGDGDFELGVEASFGENNLDFEARERSTRESTPCSLIRDPNTLNTPGSSTRPTNLSTSNRRIWNSVQSIMPTSQEIEEFFSCAEQQQQRHFAEKYNFDVVNDLPLQGRYDWVKVQP